MFRAAEMESLCGFLHDFDEESPRQALRGRIDYLRKSGVPIGSPMGKGNKSGYSLDQFCQLIFALELEEFGINPELSAEIIHQAWNNSGLYHAFHSAILCDQGKNNYAVVRLWAMSCRWSSRVSAPNIKIVDKDGLTSAVSDGCSRAAVVNISELARRMNLHAVMSGISERLNR